jgi:precorrin-4 methylase
MTRLMRVYVQQGRHIVRVEGGEALLFGCALATLDDIGRLGVALGIARLAGIFVGVPLGEAARESGCHWPHPGYN